MNDKTEQKYIDTSPDGGYVSPQDPATAFLSLEDILRISGGTDSGGFPLAAGALAIDRFHGNEETTTKENLFLEGAEYLFHANGGCMVIEARFPVQSQVHYQRTYTICQEWLENGDKDHEVLSLLLSPYLTSGCIHVLFQGLAFVLGVPDGSLGFRLYLGFDHTDTLTFETEDIDYAYISQQVQAEVQRQEKELMDNMEDAKKEEEAAGRSNSFQFGEYVQKEYGSKDITRTPEEEINKENARSVKKRNGIRIVKDETE